jgi:hypothetical protein
MGRRGKGRKAMKEIDMIKEALVSKLMTNGFGQKAKRLTLVLPDGSDGGGYCESAVNEMIKAALSTIDPDAKQQEPSDDVIKMIWASREDSPVFNGEYIEHRWRWNEEEIARVSFKAHDDAIRRECANRAVAWFNTADPAFYEHEDDDAYWDEKLRAAITGKETEK